MRLEIWLGLFGLCREIMRTRELEKSRFSRILLGLSASTFLLGSAFAQSAGKDLLTPSTTRCYIVQPHMMRGKICGTG